LVVKIPPGYLKNTQSIRKHLTYPFTKQ
jgi:hypothetical protein